MAKLSDAQKRWLEQAARRRDGWLNGACPDVTRAKLLGLGMVEATEDRYNSLLVDRTSAAVLGLNAASHVIPKISLTDAGWAATGLPRRDGRVRLLFPSADYAQMGREVWLHVASGQARVLDKSLRATRSSVFQSPDLALETFERWVEDAQATTGTVGRLAEAQTICWDGDRLDLPDGSEAAEVLAAVRGWCGQAAAPGLR